jgi:hypothetical protein
VLTGNAGGHRLPLETLIEISGDGQLTHQMAREWERTPVIEDVEPVLPDNTPYLWDPI